MPRRLSYAQGPGCSRTPPTFRGHPKLELIEDEIDIINARLAVIEKHINEQPNITVTYFLPDNKKAGGQYVTVSGNVKRLDGIKCAIIMADGKIIPIEDVRYIDGDLFKGYE